MISRFRRFHRRLVDQLPPRTAVNRRTWWFAYLRGGFVTALIDANNHVVLRRAPGLATRWDPSSLPGVMETAAHWPEMRAELDAYLASHRPPSTAQVNGLEPQSDAARSSLPMTRGEWRSVALGFYGRPIPEIAAHFPLTMAAAATLPRANTFGFSLLDSGTHIGAHSDPNRGSLRLHIPVTIPGDRGQCRIRVGDETIEWVEGEPLVFDLSVEHEAWNDSDGIRAVFIAELVAPIPGAVGWVNRAVQSAARFYPPYQGLVRRTRDIARADTSGIGLS